MASSSQSSPISNFVDYFTHIKPYHSKILEVVQKYNFYDDIVVNFTDSMSRELKLANTPLCKGVGFGYIWDDCCGFDATECCTLGKCPTDESNYQNLTPVYTYNIKSVNALEGEVVIAGDHTYDKTFQIKKIFSDKTFSVTGDITDLLGREPTFTFLPYNTIKFTINGINTITISGDRTKQLTDHRTFYVYGTGYNDGVHNVVSVLFNKQQNTTQIQVADTLIPNKPGNILLKTSSKNTGFYTATAFSFNGTDTNITLDGTHPLTLEDSYPSIVFKTGLLQNRLVQISENDDGNNGTWPISDVQYNPATGNSTIILKNSLQAYTGAIGTLDLMLRLAPEDYKIDSGCTPAKEANISVNFSETLVIQGLSNVFPSPTTTPTLTPTPTGTPATTATPTGTPLATVSPTVTATPSPTPSISISLSPTQTPTPTPTNTATITPTPSVSSAALSAILSDPTSSGVASASCGLQTVYSDAVTAITDGGCGNYIWEWEFVSGDNTITPIISDAQVTGFQKDTPSDGITYTAVYRCKVSDSCGNIVYTENLDIDITNDMGNCSELTFSVLDSDPGSANYGQSTSPTVLKSACTAGTGCFYPGSAYGLNTTTGLPELYNVSSGGVLLPASRQPQYCDGNTWVNTPGIVLVGGSGSYTIKINNVNLTCSRYVAPTDHPTAIGIMVGGNGDKTNATDSLIVYPQDDGTFTTNKAELNVPYNSTLDVYGPIFVLVSSENIPSYQLKIMADVLISDSAGATIATTLEIPVSRSADTALGDYQC